jgi:hypothetical protein
MTALFLFTQTLKNREFTFLTYTTWLQPDEYTHDWESHKTWPNQNLQSSEHHYNSQADYLASNPNKENRNLT